MHTHVHAQLHAHAAAAGMPVCVLRRRVIFSLLSLLSPSSRFSAVRECVLRVLVDAAEPEGRETLRACPGSVCDCLCVLGEEEGGVKHIMHMLTEAADDTLAHAHIERVTFKATKKATRDVLPVLLQLLHNALCVRSAVQGECVEQVARAVRVLGSEAEVILRVRASSAVLQRLAVAGVCVRTLHGESV